MQAPPVPVGLTTKAGYTVSFLAFVAAIVAFVSGDHSDQTLGTIVAGAIGLVSLAATQLGRYVQAHTSIKAQAVITEAKDEFDRGFNEGVNAGAGTPPQDVPGSGGTELP
jgi:hypothetical protein